MAQLSKGKRISGDLRNEVSASFVERYRAGESIRSIAADSGRSYGFVQGVLKDSGVEFRSRGGARTRVRAAISAVEDGVDAGEAIPEDLSPSEAVVPEKKPKKDKSEKKSKKDKAGKKAKKDKKKSKE